MRRFPFCHVAGAEAKEDGGYPYGTDPFVKFVLSVVEKEGRAMRIKPFELERYCAKYEFSAPYLLSVSITYGGGGGGGDEMTHSVCLDLSSDLIPDYLGAIPIDPSTGDDERTYYAVKQADDNRFDVRACSAEIGTSIQVIQ